LFAGLLEENEDVFGVFDTRSDEPGPLALRRLELGMMVSFMQGHWVGLRKFSLTLFDPSEVKWSRGTHSSSLQTTMRRAVPPF